MAGGFGNCIIVNYAVSCHIDAHIGGGFIGALAAYMLENSVKNRKNLNVAVVVYAHLSVSFKVVWVYHIYVVKVGSCRLVRKVYGVRERYVPYGEGLKLCRPCLESALVIVVKLRKTGRHLSASGTGSGDNNERAGSFDIFVLSVSVVAYDLAKI